ncbi:MAG: leucine-rich repeat domain-containing protein [Candidatus Hydrogenedentes bacterium]|nr:leucine-rich repeat domain-containing protein [Candidatus Hydrogenedentota bacterium]MBI3118253.1 leucine-rich repeat domain-containing protein [Candidatus Hydrogenedentota bacterium]
MKTSSVMLACALVACAVFLPGCPCPPNSIIMSDRALESAVRAALDMPFGCLTPADLLRVIELQASELAITQLDGLEFCENLITVNLSNNEIQSISEIAGLQNVTYLDLSNNQITNIEPLAGLFFLQTLILDGNDGIRDWSALEANVANGGFPEGGTVVVGAEAVEDEEGNLVPSFERAQTALVAAGVDVIITTAGPAGS